MANPIRQAPEGPARLLHEIIRALQVPQEAKDDMHTQVLALHPDDHPAPPPAPPDPPPPGFEEIPGQPGMFRRIGSGAVPQG